MSESATGPGVIGYFDEQVEAIRAHAAVAAREGDAESVHKARVATRRLKSAVEVVEPLVGGKSLRRLDRFGKKLRRRFGAIRDADVMIEHLRTLKPGPAERSAVRWLRALLVEDRSAALAKAGRKIDADATAQELSAWAPARLELAAAEPALMPAVRESAHARLDAFVADAAQLLRAKGKARAEVDVHALRIAGKALRYTLEMADAGGATLDRAIAKHFKQIQDDLGAWHDWAAMAHLAQQRAVKDQVALRDGALQRSIAALVIRATTLADRSLAAFVTCWKKEGATVERAIREALPIVRAARPSGVDQWSA